MNLQKKGYTALNVAKEILSDADAKPRHIALVHAQYPQLKSAEKDGVISESETLTALLNGG